MLVEFRAENHRSLRDEQVLTMEAGRIGDDADMRPREVAGSANKLLTVAVIYGANASGKSNVLSAMSFMREAVVASHRLWSSEEVVPRDQFAWGPKHSDPSVYEATIIIDGVRYQYGFQATDAAFTEEWLWAWPKGKKQEWFHREGQDFHFGENLGGENKLIAEVTRPNALFLSAAVQHRHAQLQPVFSWFASIRPVNLFSASRRLPVYGFPWSSEFEVARLLETNAEDGGRAVTDEDSSRLLDQFRAMLRDADIGILDLRVLKTEDERRRSSPNFALKHECGFDDAWLELREESRGTQALFHIAWPIIQAFRSGGVLVVDELERSLHPSLARQIVLQFNDPAKNHRNAQLICTTHDTNLLGSTLGEPALRRDQVWLTEKSPEGGSELYPLTDYQPRKGENIERGYLQGRYGAIPFLGNWSIWRE
ncbi:MAG TPA: ATP-binding protein [Pirellulales bacterium]|nr:ATP-binding protein [Pirellulales bacterium]